MNQRLLFRVTAPAVGVGLLLFGACLFSIRYINRLHGSLADVLAQSVTSLRAAQELEIHVRRLRFHNLLYLLDPTTPKRLDRVEADQQHFEKALAVVRQASATEPEQACVRAIESGYRQYQQQQAQLRNTASKGMSVGEFIRLADTHPVDRVVDPCDELLHINKEKMAETAAESEQVSHEAQRALLVLGLAGPIGGLVIGYGVARGLKQSIYRLSVRVQDMAQRLDQKVASVSVAADDDLRGLDRQIQHIVGKVEEVTERVQQQQRDLLRTEQLAAVGQLAASVAHEVRNPLTGIKMLVEAALRPRNPQPLGPEDLQVIHREVARLEQTVQGFLDLARLPPPQRACCDLREVVAEACNLVRTRAEQQHVHLVVPPPVPPVHVCVDRGQIVTVLVNLFLNALDAMSAGGQLEVGLDQVGDGDIQLTVADNGSGLSPQIVGRLFTPFATTKATGTGLGLSISRRILEEHGGVITAANRPEGGARFVLTLPPPD